MIGLVHSESLSILFSSLLILLYLFVICQLDVRILSQLINIYFARSNTLHNLFLNLLNVLLLITSFYFDLMGSNNLHFVFISLFTFYIYSLLKRIVVTTDVSTTQIVVTIFAFVITLVVRIALSAPLTYGQIFSLHLLLRLFLKFIFSLLLLFELHLFSIFDLSSIFFPFFISLCNTHFLSFLLLNCHFIQLFFQ